LFVLTSSPIKGGQVDPRQPVDDLRQDEDDEDCHDADGDQTVKRKTKYFNFLLIFFLGGKNQGLKESKKNTM
jgi:hypothetical protein